MAATDCHPFFKTDDLVSSGGDLLFVHNNFPAQFGSVAAAAVRAGYRCAAIASTTGRQVEGVVLAKWRAGRTSTAGILPEAVRAEADLIRAAAAANAALRLKQEGFDPVVIVGHPGWGETLYLRDIFPRAKQILYAEYYYRRADGDVGFDAEFGPAYPEVKLGLHAKNAGLALALSEADRIVAPTPFQSSRLPDIFRDRTTVIHEGIDTHLAQPAQGVIVPTLLPDGTVVDGVEPVITFVNRRFEPLRGFHVFMRALPGLQAAVPQARIVLVGDDGADGYGAAAPSGKSWRTVMMEELAGRLDLSRIHFTGRLPHSLLIDLLRHSSAHIYYTYPFVLSWSLLEAMATGCLIIGSDTPPVRDAITNGREGLLLDFFDREALTAAMVEACLRPQQFAPLRQAARYTVLARFEREACTRQWMALIDEVGRQ